MCAFLRRACVRSYVRACLRACVHRVCARVHVCVCVCGWVCAYVRDCACANVCACVSQCVRARLRTCACARTCVGVCVRARACMCVCARSQSSLTPRREQTLAIRPKDWAADREVSVTVEEKGARWRATSCQHYWAVERKYLPHNQCFKVWSLRLCTTDCGLKMLAPHPMLLGLIPQALYHSLWIKGACPTHSQCF